MGRINGYLRRKRGYVMAPTIKGKSQPPIKITVPRMTIRAKPSKPAKPAKPDYYRLGGVGTVGKGTGRGKAVEKALERGGHKRKHEAKAPTARSTQSTEYVRGEPVRVAGKGAGPRSITARKPEFGLTRTKKGVVPYKKPSTVEKK